MKCKFGRFGSSQAQYINKTTILCLTPNIQDDPSDIAQETVVVTVALNGVDFNDNDSEVAFTFIGTGGYISIWVIIIGALIFGLLIVSIFVFGVGLKVFMQERSRLQSYTHTNEVGTQMPRNRGNSRALSGAGRNSRGAMSRAYDPRGNSGSRQMGSRQMGGSRARLSSASRGGGLRFGSNNPNLNP